MPIPTLAFPHAGGSSHNFRSLGAALRGVALRALDYPGHGRRVREPLLADLERLADDALQLAMPVVRDGGYALLGHSMGARVAYLVGVRIQRLGLPPPVSVVLSGSGAPGTERDAIAHLPDREFLDELATLGGLPDAVREDPLMLDMFLPILRADVAALDAWEREPGDLEVLDVPFAVLHGREDGLAEEDAKAWARCTSRSLSFQQLEGGHFFLYENPRSAAEAIERAIVGVAPW